ncbi:MAG: response regulator [Chloroherpetonaceae bacterium]|nr:response regulator [Chloroherpetonaceae bacterium]MDW8437687.1 response regulator [Chloroherpetonaceae bacterium]
MRFSREQENDLLQKLTRLHEELNALHQAFSETSAIEMSHRERLQSLVALAAELRASLYCDAVSPNESPPIAESELNQETILIVEDDENVRALLRNHFAAERFVTLEATTAEEALKLADERVPDLIISDIVMSGMDGYALCKIFKSRLATSHIPIVLLTAKKELDDKLQGLEVGADDYICKPFDIRELTVRARNLLAQRKALRDAFLRQLTQSATDALPPREDPFVAKVRATIEKRLSDETYSVDRLAYDVCLSRVQLFRKLKSLIGLSPLEYITSIRLSRAAQLLKEGKTSIADVSMLVGFGANQSHFARRFKERFGCSPSEFAEKCARKQHSSKKT